MSIENLQDHQIRLATFQWIKEQCEYYEDIIPWDILSKGFIYNNKRITVIGQKGIWKPKEISQVPLSITKTINSPYQDVNTENGLIYYKYRGTDTQHPDNKGLRLAMKYNVPLIYFENVTPAKYFPMWPVYIVGDDPASLTFTAAVDDMQSIFNTDKKNNSVQAYDSSGKILIRKYITIATKQRLHQRSFRVRVLNAYKEQCSLCRLKHIELLDAAHIIPDGEPGGEPVIKNGISLCKIHHATYDRNIISITPDYLIEVRDDILKEHDGPMLQYGIKELHKQKIVLPAQKENYPDQELLERKYNKFKTIKI